MFASNSSFLEHDNETIRLHCKHLADVFQDEFLEAEDMYDEDVLDEEEDLEYLDEDEEDLDEEALSEVDIKSTAEF